VANHLTGLDSRVLGRHQVSQYNLVLEAVQEQIYSTANHGHRIIEVVNNPRDEDIHEVHSHALDLQVSADCCGPSSLFARTRGREL
jgi:hypothetical protein